MSAEGAVKGRQSTEGAVKEGWMPSGRVRGAVRMEAQ